MSFSGATGQTATVACNNGYFGGGTATCGTNGQFNTLTCVKYVVITTGSCDNDNNYLTKQECKASGTDAKPYNDTPFTRHDWPPGCIFGSASSYLYFNTYTVIVKPTIPCSLAYQCYCKKIPSSSSTACTATQVPNSDKSLTDSITGTLTSIFKN